MGKRLLIGLLKGAVLGGVLGAAFHVGLGWTAAAGLLGYLLAMGTGATAGILCGKPPWREGVWLEAILKGFVGVGLGALVYWVTSTWLAFSVPFALLGAEEGAAWTTQALLYLPVVGAFYGMFVELDNTGEDKRSEKAAKKRGAGASKKARVDLADLDLDALVPEPKADKKSRTAAAD
jgi:hypothetical protein